MDDDFSKKLIELISEYGFPSIESIPRFKSLFQDVFVDNPREMNLLIAGLEEGIPGVLKEKNGKVPYDIILKQIIERLYNSRGMDWGAAEWTTKVWAMAVGYSVPINQKNTEKSKEKIEIHKKNLPDQKELSPYITTNQQSFSQNTTPTQTSSSSICVGINPANMFRGNAGHTGNYLGNSVIKGFVKWKYETEKPITSSPAVDDGVVYIGSRDRHIYAIEENTGSLLWKCKLGGAIHSSPAVMNKVVYVGSNDGYLNALDTITGSLIWKYNVKDSSEYASFLTVASSPIVVDNIVYIGSPSGHVLALDVKSGTRIWAYHIGGEILGSPAFYNGLVYVGNIEGDLYALNAKTGSLIWKFELGLWSLSSQVCSSPAVANDVVCVGNGNGFLYALDIKLGLLIWKQDTGSEITCSPSIAGGTIYVGNKCGQILAFDSKTGEKKWKYNAGESVESSPAIFNNSLYVGCNNGLLYAIG